MTLVDKGNKTRTLGFGLLALAYENLNDEISIEERKKTGGTRRVEVYEHLIRNQLQVLSVYRRDDTHINRESTMCSHQHDVLGFKILQC
jgi:hypothetical protein